jgi:Zn-dependent protease with chaperone function
MPDLVNSRERVLYALVVIVSLVTYAVIGLVVLAQPEFAISVAFYGALFAVAAFFAQGHTIGRLRGNAIRAGERQFPLLHRTVQEHARRLGLGRAPEVYVVESSGLLNAFATRFLGRDFVVIHSDVLELAMAEGEPAVSFILAHELGHVWRGHLKRRWLTAPGRFTPYLGAAYSRACEYTCDRVGAHCRPDGAIQGLLVLAAGKQLHHLVDARELAAQAEAERGFWVRRGELGSSHPYLPKRVAALLRQGAPLPVSTRATSPRAA